MPKVKNIIDNLKNQGANPNFNQINLINTLCEINSCKNFFLKNKNMGLYIWGDVGRGKTLLVNSYLSQLKSDDYVSFHFIDFMNFVQEKLNTHSGKKNPLQIVCKSLTYSKKIIFIDEFQVEDVADAMIIGELLKKIIKRGTKVILTSNAHPMNLYKDGLQRKKFLDSINVFLKNINIFELTGEIDYRTRNIIKLVNTPNKNFSDKKISKLIYENFTINTSESSKIKINDRKFSCKLALNNILWIEYNSFFNQPTNSKDYKYISEKFDWIFISNFMASNDDQIDMVRRFISFIDIVYIKKSKIKFFLNNIEINEIYSGSKIDNLWVRCQSRLKEMQTDEYFFD